MASLLDRYRSLIRSMRTDVGLYRVLAIFGAISIPLYRLILPEEANDPMWQRYALGGMLAAMFFSTFVAEFFRRHVVLLAHSAFVVICLWAMQLVVLNPFKNEYLITYFVVLLICSVGFKDKRSLAAFSLINFIGILAGTVFLIPSTAINPFAFLGMATFLLIVANVTLANRAAMLGDLNLQRDLMSAIFHGSPDSIFLANAKTQEVTGCNEGALRKFDAENRKTELLAKVSDWLRKFMESGGAQPGGSFHGEYEFRDFGGNSFWGDVLVTEMEVGGRGRFLVRITDITENKAVRETLRRSDHILNRLDHLVMVGNTDADLVYVSPSVEAILGYKPEELMGKKWWQVMAHSGEEEKKYIREVATGERDPRPDEYPMRYFHKNGQEVWILWKDSSTEDNLMISVGMLHTEARRDSLIRTAIFNIAEASSTAANPVEFYERIHFEIRKVIDTPNFYIASYDDEKEEVEFAYFRDAKDQGYFQRQSNKRKAGRGITEYVLRKKHPVLVTKEELIDLDARNEIDAMGQSLPEVWLGVPMLHRDKAVGLIAIQDYDRAEAYDADDLALVTFIARQVAQFVFKLLADEALKISEERFRSIYDRAAVGIASVSPQGTFLQVNRQLCEMFGFAEQELLGINAHELVHDEDQEIGQEELERVLRGDLTHYSKEKRYIRQGGGTIHALLNVSAYREAGETKFIIAVYEDITEKILAERGTKLLLNLSNKLNEAPDASGVLTRALDELGDYLDLDRGEAWEVMADGELRLLNTTGAGTLGEKPAEPGIRIPKGAKLPLVSWADLGEAPEAFGRAEQALADGFRSVLWIAAGVSGAAHSLLLFTFRRPIYPDPRLRDLLQAAASQLLAALLRKKAEQAQKESEERYRAISEAAFEGIAIHRGDEILDANSAFAELFGYSVEEIRKLPFSGLIDAGDRENWMGNVSNGESASLEFTGLKKDGSEVHLESVGREHSWRGKPARIIALRDVTDEKIMEESREAARLNARFRAYIQNSSEIMQIVDRGGMLLYSSPSYERTTGISPETMIGRPYLDCFGSEYHDDLEAIRKKILPGEGESASVQTRLLCEKGEPRIVETIFTNLLEDPLIRGILISSKDVTDIILAQQSLQESQQRFRTLFDRSPDAIFVYNEEGYVIDVNEAACMLHETAKEELIGEHVGELVPAAEKELVVNSFPELVSGKTQYITGISEGKKGKKTPVEIRVNPIQIDQEKAVILLVRDITERKKSEAALKESEERFRALIQHATEAIVVLDLDTDRFVELNKNAVELFGYSREELITLNPASLSPELQANGINSETLSRQMISRAEKGESLVFEWDHMNKKGEVIPCEVRLTVVPSSTARLVRGATTDITSRKEAEKSMIASRERMRRHKEKLIELAAGEASNSGNLEEAFREITHAVTEVLGIHSSGIWLFDKAHKLLECQVVYNAETAEYEMVSAIEVKDCPRYVKAIHEERVIAASSARTDERTREFAEAYFTPGKIYSVLDAPVRHMGKVAGVIWNEHRHAERKWTREDLNFVASMADLAALALVAWERKQAEEKLADTLGKMQATFESTRDGILAVDNEGYVLEYNDGFHRLSGIPKETLDSGVPNPGFEIMLREMEDPERFGEVVAELEQNPNTDKGYVFGMRDGRVIEVYARPLMVGETVRGRLWFMHDITDLNRVKAALMENETKFRSLFSQANDAILVMEGATIIECNEKALQMFGREKADLVGTSLQDLSPPKQPDKRPSGEAMQEKTALAEQGEPQSFTWKHKRADGAPFDAEVSLNLIRIGEKQLMQAFVRDITEKVRAEKDLRASQRRNKAILDAIPDLMVRISARGKVLDYKLREGHLLWGREKSELNGKDITEILPATMAEKVMEHTAKALETGEGQRYETELAENGEVRDYETRLVRSGPKEALIIISDVTERKRTEKELIKRNFELDSFVYRASHDLKAPLNSLMGLISLVEMETKEDSVVQYLGMMNKSVVKLDTFIRDLADFSRNARLEVENAAIDWMASIEDTLDNLNFMKDADRVEKVVEIAEGPTFYSDRIRIGIIFNNLISNAIKYQNLQREDAQVIIRVKNDEEKCRIEIIDNGIGIAAEHQDKIFNLFFRASIQSYGSGLGMYIVKNAIDKLKGTIRIQSVEGEGTTFMIDLPNHNE